jgi:membrane protease YdiL (CAAX protease family)
VPEREPFWGYIDLLLVLGLLAASIAIIMLAAGAWIMINPTLRQDPTPLALPTQFAVYLFLYFCFYGTFKLRYNRPVFASLGWRKSSFSFAAAAFSGVLLAFGLSLLAWLLHTPKVATTFDKLAETPLSMVLLAITAVLLAPLFEELLFRGFLQPLLSRTFGVLAGILITSLLFGSLHLFEYLGVWQYMAAITLVGIALGSLRAYTNSIIPGVVMHGCFNAISVVALIVDKYVPHPPK